MRLTCGHKVTEMVILSGQHAKVVATPTHTECWTDVHTYVRMYVREAVRRVLVRCMTVFCFLRLQARVRRASDEPGETALHTTTSCTILHFN